MTKASYPKVYAVVESITYYGKRVGIGQPVREFTPEEWETARHMSGKRRYYAAVNKKPVMKVKLLETDEEIEIDAHGYQGKNSRRVKVGSIIKMYKHPKSSREWVYKLRGE